MLTSPGWFGYKDTILHSGEGPIRALKWRGNFIAWANDVGVKIQDMAVNQRITFIDRPAGSPRADLYRCHLVWQNDVTLLIAWADSVKIALIKVKYLLFNVRISCSKLGISGSMPVSMIFSPPIAKANGGAAIQSPQSLRRNC